MSIHADLVALITTVVKQTPANVFSYNWPDNFGVWPVTGHEDVDLCVGGILIDIETFSLVQRIAERYDVKPMLELIDDRNYVPGDGQTGYSECQYESWEKQWKESDFYTQYLIQELIDEQTGDFVRTARLNWLEEYLPLAEYQYRQNVEFLKMLEGFPGNHFIVSLLQKIIREATQRYRAMYIEYGLLKSNQAVDDERGFTEQTLNNCRNVLVDSLVKTPLVRLYNGQVKTVCPFHNEKTPSFVIYKDNSWHCFGCQANGQNAIDFVMKRESCNFVEAVRILSRHT